MSNLIIPDDDFSRNESLPSKYSLEDIKSIFYFLKQTRDTDIKIYDDNKVFTFNDILALNARVTEKLRLSDNVSVTTKAVISLSNKEIQSFGNWDAFRTYDWQSINEVVESVVLDWDFTVLIPQQKTLPQTHTLKVRIGSELRPSELFHLFVADGEDFEVLEASSQMICKVDFINSLLANEYKNLVTTWYEGLPKNEPTSHFVTFFRKNRHKIKSVINILAIVTGVIILNIAFKAAIDYLQSKSISQMFKWFFGFLTSSVPFLYIAYLIGEYYTDTISDLVFKFDESPLFRITRGDTNRFTQYKTNNNTLIKDIRNKLIVSLLASIIIILFGTFLPALIKKLVYYWLH